MTINRYLKSTISRINPTQMYLNVPAYINQSSVKNRVLVRSATMGNSKMLPHDGFFQRVPNEYQIWMVPNYHPIGKLSEIHLVSGGFHEIEQHEAKLLATRTSCHWLAWWHAAVFKQDLNNETCLSCLPGKCFIEAILRRLSVIVLHVVVPE